MQASDTAWDAIGHFKFDVHGKPPKKVLAALSKKARLVSKFFKGWILRDAMAVLGIAEYLLDAGVDLKPAKKIIDKALEHELSDEGLESWGHAQDRKDALNRFKDRLNGKEIDDEKLAEDNEGLLAKMAKRLG
jgi:hypothetical protein